MSCLFPHRRIDKMQVRRPCSPRNPLAFKWYDKDRLVLGKRMEEHLRFGSVLLALVLLERPGSVRR